jgi:hypothetical protein
MKTKESKKRFKETMKIVNLIKGKKAIVLVVEENNDYSYWVPADLDKITEVDKDDDAHIGGYYL